MCLNPDGLEAEVALITHDLNNVLGAVYGYVWLANRVIKDDPVAREHLNQAEATFDFARSLTDRLLALSSSPGLSNIKITVSS